MSPITIRGGAQLAPIGERHHLDRGERPVGLHRRAPAFVGSGRSVPSAGPRGNAVVTNASSYMSSLSPRRGDGRDAGGRVDTRPAPAGGRKVAGFKSSRPGFRIRLATAQQVPAGRRKARNAGDCGALRRTRPTQTRRSTPSCVGFRYGSADQSGYVRSVDGRESSDHKLLVASEPTTIQIALTLGLITGDLFLVIWLMRIF